MAILDRDGKTYKLRGPNPLMSNQSLDWDQSKVRYYNFSWTEESIKDPNSKDAKFKKENPKIDIGEELDLKLNSEWVPPFDFVDELNSTKPIEEESETVTAIMEDPVEEEEPQEINTSSKVAQIFRERGMEFYCAPVHQVTMSDDLYGTEYKMNRYGEKFIFDAVVIDENDLEIVYWCVKKMTVGSVIMPKKRESRWWRVEEVEPKSGGFITKALPSDVNPDFS